MQRLIRSFNGLVCLSLAAQLLAVAVAVGLAEPAYAQEPGFSNVNDDLPGSPAVLPAQDLVVSLSVSGENYILETENSSVSSQTQYALEGGTPVALGAGRMFDLPNDVVVNLEWSSGEEGGLNIYDPVGDRTLRLSGLSGSVCEPGTGCERPDILAFGDLTGDGFDELVIAYSGGGLQVASATDVSDFTQGLVFGELLSGDPVIEARAVAVFDAASDATGGIVIVNLPNLESYTLVAPSATTEPGLDLQLASSTDFNASSSNVSFRLQAGRFVDDLTDRQLVLGFGTADTGPVLSLIEVDQDLTTSFRVFDQPGEGSADYRLAAGWLDGSGDTDQIVLIAEDGTVVLFAATETSFSRLNAADFSVSAPGCGDQSTSVNGIALGDFDTDQQNLEIAVLMSCGTEASSDYSVVIIEVDPSDDYALSTASSHLVAGDQQLGPAGFVAADTQGQSLLPAPTRLSGRVSRIGDMRGRSTARLSAIIPVDGALDLGAATVTIERLAHEVRGAGELIKDAYGEDVFPLVLTADRHSRASRAVFKSERHARPRVRLALRRVHDDRLKVDLRVRKATIPKPPHLCSGDAPTTDVMTRLASIDDGVNPPLTVPIVAGWECRTDRSGDVRSLLLRHQR